MKKQSDVFLLLAETLKRFFARSPKYFRVFTSINAVISAVSGLSLILSQAELILPPDWFKVLSLVVSVATAYGAAMTKLPVSVPEDLPFTEKKNMEKK